MNKLRMSLQAKVHTWTDKMGFRLNSSEVIKKKGVTVNHYFLKTFDFIEQRKTDVSEKSEFICFDTYGEKIKIRSLLDLQSAFFENLSELR